MTAYQVLPGLLSEEYHALRADISAHGVRVPVDVDENGQVLDGHHRSIIAAELGIDCPRRLVAGLTEAEKVAHAIAVNAHRRHLTQEQKRNLLAVSIKSEPEASDREHARRVGASPTTAAAVREKLEAEGRVSNLDSRRGADGRTRPASQPPRPQSSPAPSGPSRPAADLATGEPESGAGELGPAAATAEAGADLASAPAPAFDPRTGELLDQYDDGETLPIAQHPDYQSEPELPPAADAVLTDDEKFRSNLVKALSPSYSVLSLKPERVIETYQPGSNAAEALDLYLGRITAWTEQVRRGLRPNLRSVR